MAYDRVVVIVEVEPDIYDVLGFSGEQGHGRVVASGLALKTCIKIAQEEGAEYRMRFEFLLEEKD